MKARKLAIIAPVMPFRGGIAQHSTLLVNALSRQLKVGLLSYDRLYPQLLYPGKHQKDESSVIKLELPATFHIDSVNPITWKSALTQLRSYQPDAVLIPWWTFFLGPFYFYLTKRLKAAGLPVVFLCHNVLDHEASFYKKIIARNVLSFGSHFIVQTNTEQRRLKSLLGNVPVTVHAIPVFDQYKKPSTLPPRRADLELLFYGFIRPYKGLDILLSALPLIKDIPFYLSIVGEPWGDDQWIFNSLSQSGLHDRVEYVGRYVSDAETAEFFSRADAVVVPYKRASGTGVVTTSFHFRKPVIASQVDGISDVVVDGQSGVLFEAGNATALAAAIRCFYENGLVNTDLAISKTILTLSWEHLASVISDIVDNLSDRACRG